ncbi:MAG: PTS sugar transporter subunit IIC [Erysipelotrichaceae bacterium]
MENNLFLQALLITLVAFFCYMHSYMGSTMWNRPLIASTLVGLVLGDLKTGIMVGATLELVFLGAVPIGASNPPDMTSGSIIGTAFVIISKQPIAASVALAVPVATLILLIDNLQMTFVLTWAGHIADKYAAQGDYKKVEWVARIASIGNKVVLALIVGVSFYLGIPMIKDVLAVIPQFIITGMDVAAGIIPAIGFAMLARMIVTKEMSPFLLAGFLLAAYMQISVLGVALFGLVIALVVYYWSKKDSNVSMEVAEDDNEF